jgi:[ribosomal protein S18]-alanine N-acetyltransferase
MIRSHDIIPPPSLPVIRRATPADIPWIDQIENEVFIDPWEPGVFAEALGYYPTTYFVAVCESKIAGFVVGALEDTGENIYGHLCNFAVSPDFQKRGIGTALMRRIEQQFALESATGAQLEVRESNLRAQRFYIRLGYQPVFQMGGYYANGEDALVMMKWFRF